MMLIRSLLIILLAGSFTAGNAQSLKDVFGKAKKIIKGEDPLSEEEIGAGLKEALNVGVTDAVDFLSAEDGYHESLYKILLPNEVKAVTSKLKNVPGFGDVEQKLILRINRAAEDAASEATPIFVDAITALTFKDVMNILMGEEDEATMYLHGQTNDQLYAAFQPVIAASLDKVNARSYWKTAVDAYNKIPFVKKTNPELDDYVTNNALNGLFGLIKVKESDIRSTVDSRSTDLLRKVFAKQD